MNAIKYIVIGFVFLIVFLMVKPFFILQEGELAVVTRFGKIVKNYADAGLKFRVPLIDHISYYPKRIQSWDGEAQRLPTEENQFIWVDTTARWKISNVTLFYESVGTLAQAQSRLDDVIDSTVRKIIAGSLLRETVRSSNIINEIERRDVFQAESGLDDSGESFSLIATTFSQTKFDTIQKGRNKLSDEMLDEARKITPQYGIDLIDIIIRQIKYSDDLTPSVYNRMIKERNQIAQAFRSDGEGEKATWFGKTEKELRTIRSDAERQAKEFKAKADAEALEIRNLVYVKNPEFAEFWMALVQYQSILPKMNKTITTDSEFFKYLHNMQGK